MPCRPVACGTALTLARAALDAGKGFVTANKAMIAHHGLALAEQAALRNAPKTANGLFIVPKIVE